MRKLAIALLAGVGLVSAAYIAHAQTNTSTMIPQPPQVPSVGTADRFNDVVGGVGRVQSIYASAAQIASVPGYYALYGGADAHGQTLTYTQTSGVSNVFAYATTSAITSVTITTDPNPGDGERLCYVGDGEATTGLTFTANTGQTIKPTISAGVSDVPICLTYVASLATWYRSN